MNHISLSKNRFILLTIAVVVVVGGGAFYGGIKYQSSVAASARAPGFANFPGGARNARGGGGVSGAVVTKDDTSLTVKLRDGSSKIVFFSPTTPVEKSVSGSAVDLASGEQISVMGTANPDGSVTAQNIQIRPALAAPVNKNY